MAKELSYKDVWDTLSKVDCSDNIEKKRNLTYISWGWTWGRLMENYRDEQIRCYVQKAREMHDDKITTGRAEVR